MLCVVYNRTLQRKEFFSRGISISHQCDFYRILFCGESLCLTIVTIITVDLSNKVNMGKCILEISPICYLFELSVLNFVIKILAVHQSADVSCRCRNFVDFNVKTFNPTLNKTKRLKYFSMEEVKIFSRERIRFRCFRSRVRLLVDLRSSLSFHIQFLIHNIESIPVIRGCHERYTCYCLSL